MVDEIQFYYRATSQEVFEDPGAIARSCLERSRFSLVLTDEWNRLAGVHQTTGRAVLRTACRRIATFLAGQQSERFPGGNVDPAPPRILRFRIGRRAG